MYAVNISDLSAPRMRRAVSFLLKDFVSDDPQTVRVGDEVDADAVVLDGPAASDQERVTALLWLLQHSVGPRKIGRRVRCYVKGPRGAWKEFISAP